MTPHHHHADDGLAELLDLGAEALRANLDEVTGWIASAAAEPPSRILDLGAGTGVGTLALLSRFPLATVTALDSSERMLHRISEKAERAGLTDRVRLVEADLDRDWPPADPSTSSGHPIRCTTRPTPRRRSGGRWPRSAPAD